MNALSITMIVVILFMIVVIFRTHPWRVLGIIVATGLIIAMVFWVRSCNADKLPPPAPPVTTVGSVKQVVQLPDHTTPCTMDIAEIRDIYTDGEAVYMLPPGWPREKAILYSGRGHLVVEGGDIHSGKWEFWSADSKKVVLIRIFAVQ